MRESKNNLVTRTLYGALFAVANIGAILCGKWGFAALLLAVLLGCTYEFYRIVAKRNYNPRYLIGILSALVLFMWNLDYVLLGGAHSQLMMVIFILTIPAMFISELFSGSQTPIGDLGSTLLSLIYVAIPTSLLLNVAMLISGGEWQGLLVICYIMIIWANDSFAYLIGVMFGRHIMFARISPKKSWEGLAGGVIGALIFGVVVALIFDQNIYVWGAMAIIIAITGVLGDLIESMFKRSVDMKDSGSILPGHGGWLDRFDALLISTPVVYVYLYILNLFEII